MNQNVLNRLSHAFELPLKYMKTSLNLPYDNIHDTMYYKLK